MMQLSYAGLSDVGRVRTANEDRWFADPGQGLYLVADGIGSSAAGGLASQIVAEVLPRLLRNKLQGHENPADPDTAKQVSAALVELSDQLRKEAQTTPGLRGIGSTVTLTLVRNGRAVVAHLGDSRAYRLRAGQLEQLTKDHTIVQLLVHRGEITVDEAASHPARGQLTRFVGMATEAIPETTCIQLAPGDRLLLCSDGLSGMLSHQQILTILNRHTSVQKACQDLIDAANEAGGKDNVTAVIVDVASNAAV